ncbi:Exonuclease family protein isoform 2 [Hibiscus syriacus]|uniref:Exonuclease family protein isoform 2 n=1 Tax=Hibiscus syriacus TaxID=106335 RepID=A0A6A2YQP6_HIBSY|nr:Exonuclease family protein isoform 2 [Hibiscus syriacus]
MCRIIAPVPLGTKITSCIESNAGSIMNEIQNGKVQRAVAMDCEMVGGGSDGSVDLCARVCLVDEDENIILHTYVQPQIPVTNYRDEVTGLTEDHLRDAMPLNEVQDKITKILYNGESVGRIPPDGGMARLLHRGVLFYRYDIQSGIHDPYEDSISVMRLCKLMRGQDHQHVVRLGDGKANCGFDSFSINGTRKEDPG